MSDSYRYHFTDPSGYLADPPYYVHRTPSAPPLPPPRPAYVPPAPSAPPMPSNYVRDDRPRPYRGLPPGTVFPPPAYNPEYPFPIPRADVERDMRLARGERPHFGHSFWQTRHRRPL
eukprot:tig00000681_g3122.t1